MSLESAEQKNYREVLYWKISDSPRRVILMNLLSLPLTIIFAILFFGLVAAFGGLPSILSFDLVEWLLILAAIIGTLVLHELVHGLVMRLFGARPQYGAMLSKGMFYATAPGHRFWRNPYLVVALGPLVGLSLLAVIGILVSSGTIWAGLLALAATLNGGGAIGDLWIATIVLRYPPSAQVVDEKDGIRIFMLSQATQ